MLREDKPISLITVTSALTSYDEEKGVTSSYVVDATTAAACSTGIKDMTHAKLMRCSMHHLPKIRLFYHSLSPFRT